MLQIRVYQMSHNQGRRAYETKVLNGTIKDASTQLALDKKVPFGITYDSEEKSRLIAYRRKVAEEASKHLDAPDPSYLKQCVNLSTRIHIAMHTCCSTGGDLDNAMRNISSVMSYLDVADKVRYLFLVAEGGRIFNAVTSSKFAVVVSIMNDVSRKRYLNLVFEDDTRGVALSQRYADLMVHMARSGYVNKHFDDVYGASSRYRKDMLLDAIHMFESSKIRRS